MPVIKANIPKELYEEIKRISERSTRSINSIVTEALEFWLIDVNAETGISARRAVNTQRSTNWTCPQCGSPVIQIPTGYAPLGFCVVCMDVTLSEEDLKKLKEEVDNDEI